MTSVRRWKWRGILRALHRDAGYLAVGLTFVYALSGLAVNHIADWDPNFEQLSTEVSLPQDFSWGDLKPGEASSAQTVARSVLGVLGRDEAIEDAYAVDPQHLDITLGNSTLYVDLSSRTVREEGQRARFLLRAANWLHLNRGKKAWTYVADAYAVALLFLATSGLFMIAGKKGLIGRGAVLALLGAAIPMLYVVLSGGPS